MRSNIPSTVITSTFCGPRTSLDADIAKPAPAQQTATADSDAATPVVPYLGQANNKVINPHAANITALNTQCAAPRLSRRSGRCPNSPEPVA
jgi:hypothetical protein